MTIQNRCLILLLCFNLLILMERATGKPLPFLTPQEEPVINATAQVIDIEKLIAKIDEVEGNKEIEEGLKNQVLELYRQASSRLETSKQYRASTEKYKADIEVAPEETKRVRQNLEEAKSKVGGVEFEILAEATTKDLESLLTKEHSDLTELKSNISQYDSQIKLEEDRPANARQQLIDAKQKLDEIEKDLKAQPPSGESQLLTEARRILLEVKKQARQTEINMLEQELLSQNARWNYSRCCVNKQLFDYLELKIESPNIRRPSMNARN